VTNKNKSGQQMDKDLTRLERWFPPRQIYLKGQNGVRFFTLSPFLQKSFAAGMILVTGWVGYTSFRTVFHEEIIEAKNSEIVALEAESEEKTQDLKILGGKILKKTETLEARQGYLNSILKNDPTGTLPEVSEPETGADEAEPVKESRVIPSGNFLIGSANAATDPDFSGKAFLDHINGRLDAVAADQDQMASQLTIFAKAKLLELDDMLAPFKLTAIDLGNATPFDLSDFGQGGPFISENLRGINFASDGPYPELQKSWTSLMRVYSGFQNFPLSEPVKDFYLSSRFGRRTDPFTKKAGWHSGIDLAGWPGTPIYATTPGVITKAGTWSTYGQMVEIDHGNGFKTRYAHMRKIITKRGQTVKPGDILGEMGCTGRCVSTHLHYEVFFNDILRNPQPFMEAPEDVQQTKDQANTTPKPNSGD